MLPASTTAITMIFFPALSAMNGLGLRAGTVGSGAKAQGNKRRNKGCGDTGGGVCTAGVTAGVPVTPEGDPAGAEEGVPAAATVAGVAFAWGAGA
jgi:hypothetical protein